MLLLAATACAPILPPPGSLPPGSASSGSVPSGGLPPSPDLVAESPSPGGIWSPFDPSGESDIEELRVLGLLIPVRGVALSGIEDSFDAPRDGGRRHDAVDILAPRGTPVIAAVDGTVLRVGTNALGGNTVWMADTDGHFVFYYAHLDRYARGIRNGVRIARGAPIGYVGTTGNAPQNLPHLHFQVMRMSDTIKWWNGTPVNPVPFLVEPTVVATTPGAAR